MEDGRKERDTKNREWKRRKEKERNRIKKEDTHNIFKTWDIFQTKRCEKRGDTGIEHKRDVKHNSKLKKNIS